jgi:hypothetical protein
MDRVWQFENYSPKKFQETYLGILIAVLWKMEKKKEDSQCLTPRERLNELWFTHTRGAPRQHRWVGDLTQAPSSMSHESIMMTEPGGVCPHPHLQILFTFTYECSHIWK